MTRITLVSTACRFRPRNYSVRRTAFLSNFVFWDIGTLTHQADRLTQGLLTGLEQAQPGTPFLDGGTRD
jgi:hypothetical protein